MTPVGQRHPIPGEYKERLNYSCQSSQTIARRALLMEPEVGFYVGAGAAQSNKGIGFGSRRKRLTGHQTHATVLSTGRFLIPL